MRPGVADPHIDETDMHALSNAGLLDIVSSTSSLVRFRVSQRAFDLLDERARQDGQPSPAELVRRYRERRHWLAGRISLIARWVVLVAGTALVIWSALTGSWAFTVIGAIGAIVGLPVTVVAQHVQRWLTDRVDEFLAGIFEPKR